MHINLQTRTKTSLKVRQVVLYYETNLRLLLYRIKSITRILEFNFRNDPVKLYTFKRYS